MLGPRVALALFAILRFHSAEGSCQTPDGKVGECISLRECQPAMRLLRGPRPLPQTSVTFLRNAHCGFEDDTPKVCCELLQTNDERRYRQATTTETPNAESDSFPPPPDVSNHRRRHLINSAQCGTITEPRILGGDKAGIFEFPWMALIAYDNLNVIEFRCGGTIINEKYILTAAHCITSLPSPLSLRGVRVGEHDISTEQDCEQESESAEVICAERYQDFEIESSHYHPDFMSPKLQNDVGLIRVKQTIDFRPRNVRPICLPMNGQISSNVKKVIVTGWGETETGASSKHLMKVQLPPVSNTRCMEIYRRTAPIGYKQMCVGGKNKKDSCIGDSGGPLQIPGISNGTIKFIQHGIVSFGLKTCGVEGYPGVYTRVVYYLDWILDNMRE